MTEPKEWTLMFYFASDNPLAPGIVSQLKAIKNAGYHPDVNVIAYFDPQPAGTPAHIFDVNAINKLKDPKPKIGFAASDSSTRDLMEDRLWRDELSRDEKTTIRELLIQRLEETQGITYNLPQAPPALPQAAPPLPVSPDDAVYLQVAPTNGATARVTTGNDATTDPGPGESLKSFLTFCAQKYQAKHYMLFLLGHGLVVGNDLFLYDENAASHSVTLLELGDMLTSFKGEIGDGQFELVSFHSCSMSSLEVAYELQGTANYMLASQGPAFVGSWPYREILLKVFDDVKKSRLQEPEDVEAMLVEIFQSVYHNSTDYLLAGYSFDLCLCELSEKKLGGVSGSLRELSDALVEGLKNVDYPMVKYAILLAHWKSQSYWQENYTDMYDFCFCLSGFCKEFMKMVKDPTPFRRIQYACESVMDVLVRANAKHPDNPVIRADFAGPDSQYSHGLSVFFPWSRPTSDRKIMKEKEGNCTEYEQYRFNQTEWFRFLNQYWGSRVSPSPDKDSTMRAPQRDEDDPRRPKSARSFQANGDDELFEDIASLMFNPEGLLNSESALNDSKVNPPDPTGDSCTCGSIKNYLRDTRTRRQRRKNANVKPAFPVNQKMFSS
jgi:hypothetical protein